MVKSMGAPLRANILDASLFAYDKRVEIAYRIDNEFQGKVSFEFPFSLVPDQSMLSLIGLWESIFLGQLCLAERIELRFPVLKGMIKDLEPLIASLYDVRCYRDRTPLVDLPIINAELVSFPPPPPPPPSSPSRELSVNRRACTLWSGGTDSTLALILLSNNSYEPVPLHFSANVDVVEIERKAVDGLAAQLDLSVQHIKIDFPEFIPVAARYSKAIARSPLENSIPHGRELLLLAPALAIATQFDATSVCPAHENEVWTAQVNYQGKSIWRWDTQSEAMTAVLDRFARKYLKPSIRIFSPVATFSDFRKFEVLLMQFPDILENTSFCYWGQWCGECIKCVRYYLYQRALGGSLITFQHNPVEERNPYLENYVYSWQDRELTYWADVQYALYTIADNEGPQLEPLLKDYRETVYPLISEEMPAIQDRVLGIYPANLLPQDWNPDLGK